MPRPRQGQVRVEHVDGACVLKLSGEHDASTADTLNSELQSALMHGSDVVVDLSAVTFMDTISLQALVAAGQQSDVASRLRLLVVTPPESFARRLLSVVNVERWLPVVDSREEALEVLRDARRPD